MTLQNRQRSAGHCGYLFIRPVPFRVPAPAAISVNRNRNHTSGSAAAGAARKRARWEDMDHCSPANEVESFRVLFGRYFDVSGHTDREIMVLVERLVDFAELVLRAH